MQTGLRLSAQQNSGFVPLSSSHKAAKLRAGALPAHRGWGSSPRASGMVVGKGEPLYQGLGLISKGDNGSATSVWSLAVTSISPTLCTGGRAGFGLKLTSETNLSCWFRQNLRPRYCLLGYKISVILEGIFPQSNCCSSVFQRIYKLKRGQL